MTAYVKSLNVLAEDAEAGFRSLVTLGASDAPQELRAEMLRAELALVLDQLAAGVREVRADVEQLIAGGEW